MQAAHCWRWTTASARRHFSGLWSSAPTWSFTPPRNISTGKGGCWAGPSWAGALAGVALDLPVYHVTEEAVKAEIAPADYDEHLALMAMAMDVDAIGEAVRGVREGES